MDLRDLGRLDLNLLVALEVLIEEQNVSKAAERLFITQSAMSKTLGRLREVFNDPLFTRSSSGMIPTPRAEQLAQSLPRVLHAVQCMVQPFDFDPMTHEAEFAIVISEHVSIWALPMMMRKIQERAPYFRVKTHRVEENQLELLSAGKLDFIVQVAQNDYAPDLNVQTIGVAPPVIFAREGHPLAQQEEITWEMIRQYPHIRNHIADINQKHFFNISNSQFVEQERQIQATLETDHIFSALEVIRTTDFLMPNLPIFVEERDLGKGIITLPLPEQEELILRFALVTHQRIDDSPAHQFMQTLMLEVIEEYRARNGLPTLAEMRELRGFDY